MYHIRVRAFTHHMHSWHIHVYICMKYEIYIYIIYLCHIEIDVLIHRNRHIIHTSLWAVGTIYKLHTNCHTISEHPEMPPVLDVPEMLMQPEEVRGFCVARVV